MYSVGEEFEVVIDDMNEYFTCIANLNLKGKEYIIGEDEEGTKRVFLYDSLDDEITVLMDDDEEDKIEHKTDKKRSSNNIKKKRKVESQSN